MNYMDISPVLSIAGSDSSGGAGIQADIKTILANGCYAMTAITAITAQNTMGVSAIEEVSPELLRLQLEAVFDDIFPNAVKIGMVSSSSIINVIADELEKYNANNIVLDPVMVSTSGSRLLKEDAKEALCERLFPMATVITPNIPEAELLCGMSIKTKEDMENAGDLLSKRYNVSVLVKGGHSINDANDMLYAGGVSYWFKGERIDNPNTHGTGCTLSSAIAANLAKGMNIVESVEGAKKYISGALKYGINLGHESGPINHGYVLMH